MRIKEFVLNCNKNAVNCLNLFESKTYFIPHGSETDEWISLMENSWFDTSWNCFSAKKEFC